MDKFSFSKIMKFLREDIWSYHRRDLSSRQFILVRILRILVLTVRSLAEGRWLLRASALTYYSLLSVVPALALVFGIAQGFGFEKNLESVLYENMIGQEELVEWIVKFAHATLEKVRGGLLALFGLVFLFYAIFSVLSQIELAFNDIWGVKRPRKLSRRILDYLALMVIFPFLMMLSGAATVFIASEVSTMVEKTAVLAPVSPVIVFFVKMVPYVALWILFTYLYIFMPNTKINFTAGALAGIIAGIAYQFFQVIYINSQILLTRYNAVYGSFAALPLFIFWLHFSWLIVLFGAEISCSYQNVDLDEIEMDRLKVSYSRKRLLTLRIMQLIIKHFAAGSRDLNARVIARTLEAPAPLVNQILYELVEAGLASEVKVGDNGEVAYQPGKDPAGLTIKSVLDDLEQNGTWNFSLAKSEELAELEKSLKNIGELVEGSPENKRLKDI